MKDYCNIRLLSGKQVNISVNSNETISNVKDKIFEHEGIPQENQKLIYGSRILENSKSITECGVLNGTSISLSTSIRGGGDPKKKIPYMIWRVYDESRWFGNYWGGIYPIIFVGLILAGIPYQKYVAPFTQQRRMQELKNVENKIKVSGIA
eukprot:GHVL01030463.1.p1 GENE.GHVL01030463.1~~GHVL01030463.1.p1  ORF type:complete len:161 (+),score=36.67 GHVL01030463.1:32-484(+)